MKWIIVEMDSNPKSTPFSVGRGQQFEGPLTKAASDVQRETFIFW